MDVLISRSTLYPIFYVKAIPEIWETDSWILSYLNWPNQKNVTKLKREDKNDLKFYDILKLMAELLKQALFQLITLSFMLQIFTAIYSFSSLAYYSHFHPPAYGSALALPPKLQARSP